MTQLTAPSTPPPSSISASASPSTPVDLLILGAGWTSTFLIPLLEEQKITYAATTRSGHNNTIPFNFDPSSSDAVGYERLPPAETVLITFPLKGDRQSKLLTDLYGETHEKIADAVRWIQLGSTGIFTEKGWNDSDSAYDKSIARAVAEDELLSHLGNRACVLNLAGLYGGTRHPQNWVTRVAKSKSEVKAKLAVHLIHGRDVSRAIVAAHEKFEKVGGKRWIVMDLHVYDWWDLFLSWGKYARESAGEGVWERAREVDKEGDGEGGLEYERWVVDLMGEEGVRALPRGIESLGRVLDGRGFWSAVGGAPEEGRAN
ncbi:hypothetical protein OEA41_003853 [Lepraria neglecta]|uniref:NAD(P)-binding protein n=1 Tax=Lepraria neglecta TaxID=209136 RepID=A0AAD9Z5B6_9LECA|nr:hypothetical protein OEA41_003853 [Lepraria neglecta]